MSDSRPILHHYAGSPFAEKARLMLGYKGLAWRSVTVPMIMPKPDVVALTGGYRRTPLLQIGADIYCDTALIARVLEGLQPTPTLFPASAPLAPLLAQWADSTLFWTVIPYTMQPAGLAAIFAGQPPEVLKAFGADRAAMTAGMKRLSAADATQQFTLALQAFEGQLADGRRFLLGSEASIADFSVGHCLWYVHRAPPMLGIYEPFPLVQQWLARVRAFGHGTPELMASEEAVALAASEGRARRFAACAVMPGQGLEAGQPVTVAATDYASDPVSGHLVGLAADEVVIARSDERAGSVHVHFPRRGFQTKAAA
jgi:glutathione S-transferase